MSQQVKLSSRLGKDDELNGLDHLADQLVADPHGIVVALVWLDVAKITTDIDNESRQPTLRVRRIEPLGSPGQSPASVRKLAEELMEKRTGRRPLPFNVIETDDGEA